MLPSWWTPKTRKACEKWAVHPDSWSNITCAGMASLHLIIVLLSEVVQQGVRGQPGQIYLEIPHVMLPIDSLILSLAQCTSEHLWRACI